MRPCISDIDKLLNFRAADAGELVTRSCMETEANRLVTQTHLAARLVEGIASECHLINSRLTVKRRFEVPDAKKFRALGFVTANAETAPNVLRRALDQRRTTFEEIRDHVVSLCQLREELLHQDAKEAREMRRRLLLQQAQQLKATATLTWLLQNPAVVSISDIPDALLPDSMRGNPRRTHSLGSGGFDAWRDRTID